MGLMELPDREFATLYLRVIATRFPTEAERRRYENILRARPRISPEEHRVMLARLAMYDKKVRVKKIKSQRLADYESGAVNWEAVDEKAFEVRREFIVRLSVDGEEVNWKVTAFTMKEARALAIKAAHDTGAVNVRLIY